MNRLAFLFATLLFAAGAQNAHALDVFACEPEWGSLVHELAGDAVNVDVGTTALQDVHVIEAKPSLIAKVRKADLVVCTGADLEIERRLVANILALLTLPARSEIARTQFEAARYKAIEATFRLAAETRRAFYRAVAARQTVLAQLAFEI
jgi:ABC-type Zn2+ transport system substrate-binding protein/surface adhesin